MNQTQAPPPALTRPSSSSSSSAPPPPLFSLHLPTHTFSVDAPPVHHLLCHADSHVLSVGTDRRHFVGLHRSELRSLHSKKIRSALAHISAVLGRDIVRRCLLNRGIDPEPVLLRHSTADQLLELCFPVDDKGKGRSRLIPIQLLPIVLAHLDGHYVCTTSRAALSAFAAALRAQLEEHLSPADAPLVLADYRACALDYMLWGPLDCPPVRPPPPPDEPAASSPSSAAPDSNGVVHCSSVTYRAAQAIVAGMLLADRTTATVCYERGASSKAKRLLHKAGDLPGWHIELTKVAGADGAPRVKRTRIDIDTDTDTDTDTDALSDEPGPGPASQQ